jgi:hypothetical protein
MNEPTTVLTDYLLASMALALARRLSCSGSHPTVLRLLWGASFLALAVAAFVGGTWHGIPPHAVPTLRQQLWAITYVTIGLADLLILAGAARAAMAGGPRVAVLALVAGRFLVYAALILERRDFRDVACEYGVTLLLLLVFSIDLARRRERAAGFVLGGVLVSFAGGLAQSLRFDLHPQFSHNDLFHVIQMGGLWLLFRAGLLLRDARGPIVTTSRSTTELKVAVRSSTSVAAAAE